MSRRDPCPAEGRRRRNGGRRRNGRGNLMRCCREEEVTVRPPVQGGGMYPTQCVVAYNAVETRGRGACASVPARGATKASIDTCANLSQKGGLCANHGVDIKRCTGEGCTRCAQNGGLCYGHGARLQICAAERCTRQLRRQGGRLGRLCEYCVVAHQK